MLSKYLRLMVLFMVVVGVSACSSTKDGDLEGSDSVVHETITPGPLEDPLFGNYGEDGSLYGSPLNAPTPGTQDDLVVNVGDRVFFGYDRYDLTEEARATLKLQAEWLKQYPAVNVIIEGHTDERGTREYNLALGERRANSAKNYLVALGVSPSRITTVSFGKERPAVLESTPSAWAQNRRAVTTVE